VEDVLVALWIALRASMCSCFDFAFPTSKKPGLVQCSCISSSLLYYFTTTHRVFVNIRVSLAYYTRMAFYPVFFRGTPVKYINTSPYRITCAQHGCCQCGFYVDFMELFGVVHADNVCMAANAAYPVCKTHRLDTAGDAGGANMWQPRHPREKGAHPTRLHQSILCAQHSFHHCVLCYSGL